MLNINCVTVQAHLVFSSPELQAAKMCCNAAKVIGVVQVLQCKRCNSIASQSCYKRSMLFCSRDQCYAEDQGHVSYRVKIELQCGDLWKFKAAVQAARPNMRGAAIFFRKRIHSNDIIDGAGM